jgi:hypothetical protein
MPKSPFHGIRRKAEKFHEVFNVTIVILKYFKNQSKIKKGVDK